MPLFSIIVKYMIIGIDIGSTTTKAVALEENDVIKMVKTRAIDAITAATGALGKIIIENNINMPDIKRIVITGAGSSKISTNLFGIPTEQIDEFTAIGAGGMFLSKQDNIIITNIGTGTVIIEASKKKISHFGGTGVGGGTIMGLSKKLLMIDNFDDLIHLAANGDLKQIDLLISDITNTELGFLNKAATAANFGKMLGTASQEDLAIGIFNLVYQVIGMLSVFAARNKNLNHIIVTGSGSNNPIGKNILSTITLMYGIEFEYPKDAEYTTAIGAALTCKNGSH